MNKNNKSGATGVSYEPKAKKFRAYITKNGEKIRLGYSSTLEGAKALRLEAERFYSFSFSETNLKVLSYLGYKEGTKEYDEAKNLLYEALISYPGRISFGVYAVGYIRQHNSDSNPPKNEYNYSLFDLLLQDEIMRSWVNGTSLRKLATQKNTTPVAINKHINTLLYTTIRYNKK